MPVSDARYLDADVAFAEVVERAARPADVNRLVAAAVRLRAATLALRGEDAAMNPQPATCETVAWCDATCGNFTPDVRGTRTARWHTRSFDEVATQGGAHAAAGLTTLRVSLGQSELPPEETPEAGDHDTTVWVDLSRPGLEPIELSLELTVDQAAALAGSLAAAVSAARRSG